MIAAVSASVGPFRAARAATIGLSLIGVIVFGGLLAVVQSSERGFEARAQAFIVHEIEQQYDFALDSLPFQRVKGLLAEEAEARQRAVSDFIAATIGAMCRLDCAQRAQLEAVMEEHRP
jgi:hypothetical protein